MIDTDAHPTLPADARVAYDQYGDHAHVLVALLHERTWRGADGAVVAFAESPGAWVAAGLPLTSANATPRAAAAFAADANAARRHALWFAVEDPDRLPTWQHLRVGSLPEWSPEGWERALASHRRVREQLRRARAKGVTIRALPMHALAADDHAALARLEDAWRRSRRMEPMGFVVAHEHAPASIYRRAWVAERQGRVVASVTAVPIPARQSWLVEDVRRDGAPNGTSELLFDAVVRDLAADGAAWITPGMVALHGIERPWLRLVRRLARPLYDFEGLAFFRTRMHPDRWRPVYLSHPPAVRESRAVREVLRAFAGGSLIAFAVRSLLRRPAAVAWLLAVGLVPWTLAIAAMALVGAEGLLGYSRLELGAWALFDAALAALLWTAARTRHPQPYVAAVLAAAGDAALSVLHLVGVGLGETLPQVLLRLLSAGAPLLATGLLLVARARNVTHRPHAPS